MIQAEIQRLDDPGAVDLLDLDRQSRTPPLRYSHRTCISTSQDEDDLIGASRLTLKVCQTSLKMLRTVIARNQDAQSHNLAMFILAQGIVRSVLISERRICR